MTRPDVNHFLRALVAASALAASVFAPSQTQVSGAHASTALAPAVTKETKSQVLDSITDILENKAFVPGVDFEKWPKFLAEQQAHIDAATSPREFAAAVNDALHEFGFSHIVLATPEAAEARINRQSVGVGILLQVEPEGLRVLNVIDQTPAAEAGIEAGDLVIEGDGKKPKSPLDLLGDEGSTLVLKVKKSNGKTKEYKLVRRKYSNVRPETLSWPSKDTALITIHTFDISYDRTRVEDLMRQASSAKNLIVDLRSNPGGAVLNLMHFMGTVLPPGTPIGTFVSRNTVNSYVKEENGKPTDLAAIARWSPLKLRASKARIPYFRGRVAVLVNGGSGSAAEIAAAALQDTLNAPVVGSKSAGAVLVSVMAKLPQDYMLQYPITDFVTVNGVRLEGNGVSPVVEAPAISKFGQPDVAVQKAVALLHRKQPIENPVIHT